MRLSSRLSVVAAVAIAGSDGALWFTGASNLIGRITTSATTGKTTFISAPGAAGIPVKVVTRMATKHVIMVTKHVTTATKHVSS